MGCRSWKQPHRLSGILSTSLNLKMETARLAKREWPASVTQLGRGTSHTLLRCRCLLLFLLFSHFLSDWGHISHALVSAAPGGGLLEFLLSPMVLSGGHADQSRTGCFSQTPCPFPRWEACIIHSQAPCNPRKDLGPPSWDRRPSR